MPWVVDTCVLIDVLEADPKFGLKSAAMLEMCLTEGLVVCPVTYAELAPAFGGSVSLQDEFLGAVGARSHEPWTWQDTLTTHDAWGRFTRTRRERNLPRRPIANILIGAYASRFAGIITRNPNDFRAVFPRLALRVPGET